IAVQIRSGDEQLREIVDAINDFDTRLALRAEREFLRLLGADCNQPVGVLAVIDGPIMKIRGQIFDLGATAPRKDLVQGPSEDARSGKEIVRLEGGDPFVFGRGAEEAKAIVDAGLAFEIVPGITSAIAGPAYAGIPVTHRAENSHVTFFTGHEDPSKTKSAI